MDKETQAIKERFVQASKLLKNGQINAAEFICNEILSQRHNEPHTLQLLGIIKINRKDYSQAIRYLKQSLQTIPNNAICHHNLASAYKLLGDIPHAEAHYLTAIKQKPDYIAAYFNFIFITDIDQHLNIIKDIQRLLENRQLSSHDRALLHFAAARYFHHVKEYQRAFHQFEKANQCLAGKFNAQGHHQMVQSLTLKYNKEFVTQSAAKGNTKITPVFIIGMPASGTGILEHLLEHHPEVNLIGSNTDFLVLARELGRIRPGNLPYPDCISTLSDAVIHRCANVYLKHCRINEPNKIILNSFPLNFIHIGLIKLLFPNAKFIHTQRHPLDTCLAGFFNVLQHHYGFTTSLDQLSHYYLDYLKLMQHWQDLYKKDILNIHFESLLKNQSRQVEKILKFVKINSDTGFLEGTTPEQYYNYEPDFSSSYLRQVPTLENRLKPYIDSYPKI